MQKIKIGHGAKFRDRDNFFPPVLFPFRAILHRIVTYGVLHALLLIEIWLILLTRVSCVCRLLARAAKNPFAFAPLAAILFAWFWRDNRTSLYVHWLELCRPTVCEGSLRRKTRRRPGFPYTSAVWWERFTLTHLQSTKLQPRSTS